MDATPSTGSRWSDAIHRRPAIAAAGLLMTGIFLHRDVPAWPTVWSSIALALGVLGVVMIRREIPCCLLLTMSLVALGTALGQQSKYFYSPGEISLFTSEHPEIAQLEVVIEDPPRILGANRPYPGPDQRRQVTRGRVTRVLTVDGWTLASGTLLLNFNEPIETLR